MRERVYIWECVQRECIDDVLLFSNAHTTPPTAYTYSISPLPSPSRVLVCFRDGSLVLVAANPFLAEEGSTADRSRPQTNSMAPNNPSSSPHSLAQVARVTLQPHLGAPAFAVWHPSDTFVLVFCKNGEVIALDTALQPLFFLDQQGGLDPKPLRLTSVLGFDASVAPKVTSAVWVRDLCSVCVYVSVNSLHARAIEEV